MNSKAIYVCGLLKTFEHTVDSINKNLIDVNDCDVYMCVWDRLGIDPKHSKVSQINMKDRKVKDTDIQKFNKVKDFSIWTFYSNCTDVTEKVKIPNYIKTSHPIHYYSTIPLAFMVNECDKLRKKSGKEYDQIIKIRPDLLIKTPFKKDLVGFNSNNHRINPATQVSDKFVGGDLESMEEYCDFYNCLNGYWSININLVGERLLKYHMEQKKIKVNYFNHSLKVVREDLRK